MPEKITDNIHTDPATGLTHADSANRLLQYGYNEVPDKKTDPILGFLLKFWGLTAWILEIIVLLSWFLHKRSDAYIVVGLLFFNAILSFFQEYKASKALEALKNKLHIYVKVLRDSIWKTVPARELVPGDVIRIRLGDFVPADIKILTGSIKIDQSSLTGESKEIGKKENEVVYSGSIVTKGEATGIVTLTGNKTYFGKTVQLVNTAKPKSHIDEIISIVVQRLMIIVGAALLLALVVSFLKGIAILEILPLMLVILLGSVPVALGAMFTVSMAIGSKELVKQGVLVTRLNAPDDAASMDVLCVDKTGTLTINQLTVANILPSEGFTKSDVLLFGALASQEANHDSIDMAFINAAKETHGLYNSFVQKTFTPFDPKNRKTEATIEKGNEKFTVMKGAFNVISQNCLLDEKAIASLQNQINAFAQSGYRTIAVAKKKDTGKPIFVGIAALHDPPRPDSLKILNELKDLGVTIKMLTGDALPIALEISKTLNIGDKILSASAFKDSSMSDPARAGELLEKNNGFAEVYPEDKYNIVKTLQKNHHIVGMTGDGVNDAPALKQAEVGIAVSNASDVAKGAASIVLTQEGLLNILAPIKVGRMMFERINIWILNKIARTISKTCFLVFAFLITGKFIISATAMLIMIFMTDFVKISLSTDHVNWSKKPAKWNINALVKIGAAIGLFMTIESFGLLYIGFKYFHLNTDSNALNTFSFEILLFLALFSIFVVRSKKHFWSFPRPGKLLFFLILGDLILGLIFSTYGLLGFKAIPIDETLIVLGYTSWFSLGLNDYMKYLLLKKWRLDVV